jgi:hemerythrin
MKAMLSEPIALPFHVAALRKKMRDHFSREAALVEAAGTPMCCDHRNEHDGMLDLCDRAFALSGRNPRAARALLRSRLPRMMRDHINSMDQIAVLILRAAAQDRAASIGPRR